MRTSGNRLSAPGPSKKTPGAWKTIEQLPCAWQSLENGLELLHVALSKVWPLKTSHRRELPGDIARLSRLLTTERYTLATPYWSKPAFISAYLYYFLPWNIIRLASLLKNLRLVQPDMINDLAPALYDLGSGPLTLPLALWIARPEWRKKPIQLFAMDKARQPLELGIRLFRALAELNNESPWPASLKTGSIKATNYALWKSPENYVWLAGSAFSLNELKSSPRHHSAHDREDEETDHNEFYDELLAAWRPLWLAGPGAVPAPLMLFVEPGTRLGGTALGGIRKSAVEAGLLPLSPCTHGHKCPLADTSHPKTSYQASWCHFRFAVHGAPEWLLNLSREAGLFKTSLSVSYLLLSQKSERRHPGLLARVISQPFPVNGLAGECRYACCDKGLLLLEDAKTLISGTLTSVSPTGRVDSKSSAIVCKPSADPSS